MFEACGLIKSFIPVACLGFVMTACSTSNQATTSTEKSSGIAAETIFAPGQTDIVGLVQLSICQDGEGNWGFTGSDAFGFQPGFGAPVIGSNGDVNLQNIGTNGDVIIMANICPFIDSNASDMVFYQGTGNPGPDPYQAVGIADCGNNANCTGQTNPPSYGEEYWPSEFTAPLTSQDDSTLVFIDLDDAPGRNKIYYYAIRILNVNSNEVTVLDPKITNKGDNR